MTAASPETKHPGVNPFLFWFGVGGGTAAWILHLLAGYWVIEAACPATGTALPIFLVVLTVLLTAVAGAATYASWVALRDLPEKRESTAVPPSPTPSLLPWRRGNPEDAPPAGAWDPVPGPARNRLLALTGLGMNALSVGMIVLAVFPALAYGPCW